MPRGKARMPAIIVTLGAISAYGKSLDRKSPGRWETGSRSGVVTATPIEPASLITYVSAAGLAAAVEDRRDLGAGSARCVGNALLLREYLDQHVGDHVRALHVRPVLRVRDEPAVLGGVEESRVDAGAEAEQRCGVGDHAADS